MRTRETYVVVYIRVSTPSRLYVAIALSEKGRKFLEEQEKQAVSKNQSSRQQDLSEKRLEEEIPKDKNADFRL